MNKQQENYIRKLVRKKINEAYHSKDVYDKKREYAARKMAKNKDIDTMTDEQHDAVANLCSIRHELHTNMHNVAISDDQNIKKKIVLANIQLRESDLPHMSFVPLDEIDYIDIDSIEDLKLMGENPENDEEKNEWYTENYYRISNELSELNSNIEKYLKQIDEKYGTSYCPTGLSRVF
ncbi:MAG: hypothetical protein WC466_08610 [Candidatus Izemoplasmatales bacterium]